MTESSKKLGPAPRVGYYHTLAIEAGEAFFNALIQEGVSWDVNPVWIKEWVLQAKSKSPVGPVEFLSMKSEVREERILSWAAKLTGLPILEPDAIIASAETHYTTEGLPMALLSKSDFGAVTIVHCLPFLERIIDLGLIADIYGAIKVNFVLCTAVNFQKHIERIHSSGKSQNRLFIRADQDTSPKFQKEISVLRQRKLLPEDFPLEATRDEILAKIMEKRPAMGDPGESEWWALTTAAPFVKLAAIASSTELSQILLPATQKAFNIVPICEYAGNLTVATRRGFRGTLRQDIVGELQKRCRINWVICPPGTINEIITANLTTSISTTTMASQIDIVAVPETEDIEVIDIQELADGSDASVIKLVQTILVEAINKKATDIHIAAHPNRTRVRYRIDGYLVDAPFSLTFSFWKAILSRIKIMSGIDIKFSPVAQDGKFPMTVSNTEYDIRVNTCPTIYGEKATLRVQKKEEQIPTLEGLGFLNHEKRLIQDVIEGDHGLLIICGPTGSGKSLAYGTKVLKYDGTIVDVESLRIGDLLMGPDSKPKRVLNTKPGFGPMYEIIPEKGEKWSCNDVHIMTLGMKEDKGRTKALGKLTQDAEAIYQAYGENLCDERGNPRRKTYKRIVDVELNAFLSRTTKENRSKYWKLMRTGVNFKKNPREASIDKDHFFYLGLEIHKFLNPDGLDKNIYDWIAKFARKHKYQVKTSNSASNSIEIEEGRGYKINALISECIEKSKGNKLSIPLWIKTISKENRLFLLRGILNTPEKLDLAGCLGIPKKYNNFTKDLLFLVQSLGLEVETHKEKNGQNKVYVKGYSDKEILAKHPNPQFVNWDMKKLKDNKYFGILLDGDGRFLLGDFTITHNTTTLSAAMYLIDRQRYNVITAENPVEIRIPNVEQTPIDNTGMTFAKFVPAALRQDPDYIMIGETRDRETTEEVIRAAITGHVVMSTLHTNSAAGAPSRLIDMGGQPYLITDALKAVCAQRLIRRLCPNCARPSGDFPTTDEMKRAQINPAWLAGCETLMEPVGCKLCNGTGYSGRTAIIEGYFTSPEIRRIILRDNADSEKIRREIENQGGKTLYQHAVELAANRLTSLTEAMTVKNLDA